jgi:Ni,Fe-hydrogenase III large subunit
MTSSVVTVPVDRVIASREFFETIKNRLAAGARPMAFWGAPAPDPADVLLTLLLDAGTGLEVLRTSVHRTTGFHSLSRDHAAFHMFEREIFEQHGAKPHDHPWLKPVRYSGPQQEKTGEYPFYSLQGKEVHEVAVGPIHAGVIEPGHVRFMCLGEVVHHLEIQLGFQHRGVEDLLLRGNPRHLAPLVEGISGDTSVAHTWAYAAALEALSGSGVSDETETSRAVGLELERVAMHLAGLSGLATDVAFLQGSTSYGRLRTTAINTSMLLCGSRFGRGWVRPGGARGRFSSEERTTLLANLKLLRDDLAIIHERFVSSVSVRHRLWGVGTVTREQAVDVGLVGMSARACGVDLDLRGRIQQGAYARIPITTVTQPTGDCWARAMIRIGELGQSLQWLTAATEGLPSLKRETAVVGALKPSTLAVSVVEGWRGEVVHCLETDAAGALSFYKVQDPSLRNWFGLALAVRNNDIADFPICNKSFDLSYCGNDL